MPRADPFQQAGVLFQILPYIEQQNLYTSGNNGADPGNADQDVLLPVAAAGDHASRARAGSRWRSTTMPADVERYDGRLGPGRPTSGCWNWWGDGTGDSSNQNFYKTTVFVRGGKDGRAFPAGAAAGNHRRHVEHGDHGREIRRYDAISPAADQLDPPEAGASPNSGFTDSGYWLGWAWGTMRCTQGGPIRDQRFTRPPHWWQMFGSAHPSGINAVVCRRLGAADHLFDSQPDFSARLPQGRWAESSI